MKGSTDGYYIGDTGILVRMFRPHGPDKCPLVVLLHGFPGIETTTTSPMPCRRRAAPC